jgi:glutamine amidotransferase
MKTVIIKYNAGNIKSVLFALERIGNIAIVTDNAEEILSADKVILPGVGEASSAMASLKEKNLDQLIRDLKQPFLGICLGMQLLAARSEENDTECLGIIKDLTVKKFRSETAGIKVPLIGWNTIYNLAPPLFNKVTENSYCYFVHSYFLEKCEHTIAESDYISPYSAAVQKNNYFGVQFHPEKSSAAGELILKNFLSL